MSDGTKELAAELQAQGLRHGQIHLQIEEQYHGHYHGHWHGHTEEQNQASLPDEAVRPSHPIEASAHPVLAIRSHSGVAGDMLLAGFAAIFLELDGVDPASPEADTWLQELCGGILPELGYVKLDSKLVNGISGYQLQVQLPCVHEHRHLQEISHIIAVANMSHQARNLANACFQLLAQCESLAHGIASEDVHFHEVGALDSILDICATCEVYTRLGSPEVHCGSLPIADGQVHCAHGLLPAPAPATLRLLRGIPVHPFPGDLHAGELLTPTGLALLKTFQTHFGRWPALHITATAGVYGQKTFANAPNGVLFAFGHCEVPREPH